MAEDDREGERRALLKSVKHGSNLSQENAQVNRKMARAYNGGARGVDLVPVEILREYEEALRDESASNMEFADALRQEIARRG